MQDEAKTVKKQGNQMTTVPAAVVQQFRGTVGVKRQSPKSSGDHQGHETRPGGWGSSMGIEQTVLEDCTPRGGWGKEATTD